MALVKSWKDKILDYEIETRISAMIGMSTSIGWKDKILDYEIETEAKVSSQPTGCGELKR